MQMRFKDLRCAKQQCVTPDFRWSVDVITHEKPEKSDCCSYVRRIGLPFRTFTVPRQKPRRAGRQLNGLCSRSCPAKIYRKRNCRLREIGLLKIWGQTRHLQKRHLKRHHLASKIEITFKPIEKTAEESIPLVSLGTEGAVLLD